MNRWWTIALLVLVLFILFQANRPSITRRDEQRRVQGMSLANEIGI
jgi:hypothetical protein